MRARVLAVCLAGTFFAVSLGVQPASAATRTIVVTPHTALADGNVVAVSGSGFTASTQIGLCQAVVQGTAGLEDCGAGATALVNADASGNLSTSFTVRRFLIVGGQQIDCAAPGAACALGAAELSDITGTIAVAPLTFSTATGTPRPDLVFKRRDNGQLLDDNVYFTNTSEPPQHGHFIAPGGTWTFALVVQNDGDVADDLVLTSPFPSGPPIDVHYFVGYFDVSSAVNGSGLTFHNVAPGGSVAFAVQFRADPSVFQGATGLDRLEVRSGAAPELVDFVTTKVVAT